MVLKHYVFVLLFPLVLVKTQFTDKDTEAWVTFHARLYHGANCEARQKHTEGRARCSASCLKPSNPLAQAKVTNTLLVMASDFSSFPRLPPSPSASQATDPDSLQCRSSACQATLPALLLLLGCPHCLPRAVPTALHGQYCSTYSVTLSILSTCRHHPAFPL